jgi:hypothetical protein
LAFHIVVKGAMEEGDEVGSSNFHVLTSSSLVLFTTVNTDIIYSPHPEKKTKLWQLLCMRYQQHCHSNFGLLLCITYQYLSQPDTSFTKPDDQWVNFRPLGFTKSIPMSPENLVSWI